MCPRNTRSGQGTNTRPGWISGYRVSRGPKPLEKEHGGDKPEGFSQSLNIRVPNIVPTREREERAGKGKQKTGWVGGKEKKLNDFDQMMRASRADSEGVLRFASRNKRKL